MKLLVPTLKSTVPERLLLFVLTGIWAVSCQRDKPSENILQTKIWEIVQNFPQDRSYEGAKITLHNGKAFVSTFGHRGIQSGSAGVLHDFKGSFFYQNEGSWYAYSVSNEAIVNLKTFKDELYGIIEKKVPYMQGAIQAYKHTYFLGRWGNNSFVKLDTLTYADHNHIQQESLSSTILWENGNKLHLVALVGAREVRVWVIENNQLKELGAVGDFQFVNYIAIDNEQISFTDHHQTLATQTRTVENVSGHYFNGDTFSKGTKHTFFWEENNPASNKYDYYVAIKGTLYAYRLNELHRLGQQQVISKLPSEQKFSQGSGYMMNGNGKVYSLIINKQLQVQELGIFDGLFFRKMTYKLPEILDPNSKLVDVSEDADSVYLLLLNRGQYVVVKTNKISITI